MEIIDESATWGLVPTAVVADAGYGEITGFRLGLKTRQIPYVLAVKATTSGHRIDETPELVAYSGRGPRGRPEYRQDSVNLRQIALEWVWQPEMASLCRGVAI